MLGAGQALGKHPVVRRADAEHTLPHLMRLRHGTGGKALVLDAAAAVVLHGLYGLCGLALRHDGVVLAVIGPDGLMLDGGKSAGGGVPLGGHHAAHGDSGRKEVRIGEDHVPNAGAAHGHTFDVDAVGVNCVGGNVIVDHLLDGGHGLRGGPVVARALGSDDEGGVLFQLSVRHIEGGAVVGQQLGAVGALAVLAVQEHHQGQLAPQTQLITLGVESAVLQAAAAACLEALGQLVPALCSHIYNGQAVLIPVVCKSDAASAQHACNSCNSSGVAKKISSAEFHDTIPPCVRKRTRFLLSCTQAFWCALPKINTQSSSIQDELMQFGETDILVYQELCKITRRKFRKLAGKPASEKRLKNNRCRMTKSLLQKRLQQAGTDI